MSRRSSFDNDDVTGEEPGFTPEEVALAEEEALAMVYGMAGCNPEFAGDPLSDPEMMSIFQARKEEVLLVLRAQRESKE